MFSPVDGDQLVSVGDLIKKGPDSAGVVRLLRSLVEQGISVSHVLGNHEGNLRARVRLPNGFDRELRLLIDSMSAEDLSWLLDAPLHLELPAFGARVLHGGILPSWRDLPPADADTAEASDPERMDLVMRTRNLSGPGPRRLVTRVRKNGKRGRSFRLAEDQRLPEAPAGGTLEVEEITLPLHSFLGLREIGAGDPNWPTLYDGRFGHIYFGHQPFLDHDAPVSFPHATGLDLGCVYGGWLASVVLEEGRAPETLTVRAEREYSRWGF